MNERKLGRSDISIPPIGLGLWQLSEAQGFHKFFWDKVSDADEIIRTAWENGITFFDTAELYGNGRSELALARGLQSAGVPDERAVVATKWNPLFRRARNMRKTIEVRLQKLSPYSIDLYQIHNPLSFSSVESEMKEMAQLIELGKIRTAGVSNFSADRMRRAFETLESLGHTLVSNQMPYSLVDRRIESSGVMDTAKELGISIIAYSPLGMGILSGKFHDDPKKIDRKPFLRRRRFKKLLKRTELLVSVLKDIAAEVNATPAQVSLNWLITQHPETVIAIPGASRPEQALANANAMSFTLSSEQRNTLEEVSQIFL